MFTITINFHPDRLTADNTPLLLAMAQSGVLKSQFETQTSNGGLTATKVVSVGCGKREYLMERTMTLPITCGPSMAR
ncbi:hypothetical protein JCM19235_4336 [Vibrio maritimus]|uniref:Uncharacterized protein n=1 Tax=Vibrio maritimus TaxID=990268 RepID=A0A090RXY5_9VIBR|nr:hypothetical protein JCM19235_4336 [Vibrio maritimus]